MSVERKLPRLQMRQAAGTTASAPRLPSAAVAGLVAGGVFIGLNMWFATTQGRSPLAPLKLIATLVMDGPASALGQGAPWVGIAIHAVLSATFGLMFALATPWLRTRGSVVSGGILYGAVLYLVNFQVLGRTLLPQFQNPNPALEASLHLLFGAVLGAALLSDALPGDIFARRSAAPVRWLGATASAAVLLIHFATAGHHFGAEPYVGALFVIASALLTYVGIALVRRNDLLAWSTGAIVHAGMFVGLILSRTIGLPGYSPEGWPTLGTETLVLEGIYLAAFVIAMLARRKPSPMRG